MRKWIVCLLLLTLLMALLPSQALASHSRGHDSPVAIEFVPPSPISPQFVGPVILVCDGELVEVTGPLIASPRMGTPGPPNVTRPEITTPPSPILPPSPVLPPNPC